MSEIWAQVHVCISKCFYVFLRPKVSFDMELGVKKRRGASLLTKGLEVDDSKLGNVCESLIQRMSLIEERPEILEELMADVIALIRSEDWTESKDFYGIMVSLLNYGIKFGVSEEECLEVLEAVTFINFSPELQFPVDWALQFLGDERADLRNRTIRICRNVTQHCREFYGVCMEHKVLETVVEIMDVDCECFVSGCAFLASFIEKFKENLETEQILFIANRAIKSGRTETLEIVLELLKIRGILPDLQSMGLNDYVIECMRQPCDDKILFDMLTQLSIFTGTGSSVFDSDQFFGSFNTRFSHSDESGKLGALKFAYFLYPSYAQELLDCGFVFTVLSLLGDCSFQLSLGCCKFLSLVFSEATSVTIEQLVNEDVIASFLRLLDMQNVNIVNEVTELLVVILSSNEKHFSQIYQVCHVIECLELLMNNETKEIARAAEYALTHISS